MGVSDRDAGNSANAAAAAAVTIAKRVSHGHGSIKHYIASLNITFGRQLLVAAIFSSGTRVSVYFGRCELVIMGFSSQNITHNLPNCIVNHLNNFIVIAIYSKTWGTHGKHGPLITESTSISSVIHCSTALRIHAWAPIPTHSWDHCHFFVCSQPLRRYTPYMALLNSHKKILIDSKLLTLRFCED